MADKTSSTMTIDAPKSVIMAVITDFAAYPDWASGIKAAEVVQVGSDGRPAQVRFTLDAGIIRDSYVLGYRWQGDDEVRWELAERGTMISDMSGAYLLKEAADGTDVTYELAVGLAVPMIGLMKRRAEKTIIDTALKGLRGRAKQVAGGSGGGA
ncbi:MAG TPA: SRPBCC family protein [Streptosporangiaceae bacterium]|jgi:polyketide cyclase/dehydrase/lipid transport protein|nr:SRPBCC family protein [Streptosporangiaceae bacterium]